MLSTNRVRHALKFREVAVVEIRAVTPGLLALTFEGDSLRDFASLGFDDHVKLMLPPAPGAAILPPEMTAEGPRPPEGTVPPVMRDFTPRRIDLAAGRLVIEFFVHAGGFASDWATNAKVGSRAILGGPRGSLVVPTEFQVHVFAGDETALPAIARRLEELPAGTQAHVVVELIDDAHRLSFDTRADARIDWVKAGHDDTLATALRAMSFPVGETFAWAAGEAASMKLARDALRDRGVTSAQSRVSAYWKRGAVAHHEDFA